ncbi:hypothetical protein CEXT_475441 [Caerostris extrusa]|uniref:Uncharacterized protein n=1 Tax=Caerostris extrusa TaxID=172846 RepID=A0AAV4XDV5_CAEEX|nr:hypothetical protein CEXT_475441 [Caerostris extrusa]
MQTNSLKGGQEGLLLPPPPAINLSTPSTAETQKKHVRSFSQNATAMVLMLLTVFDAEHHYSTLMSFSIDSVFSMISMSFSDACNITCLDVENDIVGHL